MASNEDDVSLTKWLSQWGQYSSASSISRASFLNAFLHCM